MSNGIEGEDQYRLFVKIRETLKYYKGEILPFVNINCRKDMTAGDIDGIMWDYNKKILRIIEAKRWFERQKESQNKILRFLQDNLSIKEMGYTFEIYKIIGDPPYDNCQIYSYTENVSAYNITFNELKDFLEMNKSFKFLKNNNPNPKMIR